MNNEYYSSQSLFELNITSLSAYTNYTVKVRPVTKCIGKYATASNRTDEDSRCMIYHNTTISCLNVSYKNKT